MKRHQRGIELSPLLLSGKVRLRGLRLLGSGHQVFGLGSFPGILLACKSRASWRAWVSPFLWRRLLAFGLLVLGPRGGLAMHKQPVAAGRNGLRLQLKGFA
jgi:hypothetical protein